MEVDSNANEDEVYSSTDNFQGDSSTNTLDDSDLDIQNYSMQDSVTRLEEDNYDSDDLIDTDSNKAKKTS